MEESIFEMIERLKDELKYASSPEVIFRKGEPLAMAEEAIEIMQARIIQAGYIVEMIEGKINTQQGVQADAKKTGAA